MATQVAQAFDDSMAHSGADGAGEPQECFVLKWSEYHTNVAESFKLMRADGDFLDTTVACSGSEQLQAHRVVLSAFSPYLKGMLRNNPQANPVLIMPPNVKFVDLHSLLEFMYHGEVRVPADNLESLMQLAQLLRVKGLTEEKEGLEEYGHKVEDTSYPSGSMSSGTPQQPAIHSIPTNKADVEPHKKRKRMTSTSTVASESNDDDSRLSHPASYNQGNYPQNYQNTSVSNDYGDINQSINSGTYEAMHPGGSNGGDGMSGSGIKLSGLVCPQCRIVCQGVPAFKEHMAAAHGVINTPPATPAQTPVKVSDTPKIENIPTPVNPSTWNPSNVQGQVSIVKKEEKVDYDDKTINQQYNNQKYSTSNDLDYERETFYCDICPKEKSEKKPFPSEQKLISHKKRQHKEDDLDEEDLQSHGELSAYDDTNGIPSPLSQNETVMTAPPQRPNPSSTPTQFNKRIGRGSSNRGRSPALANRTKKGMSMDKSDNMHGGKMEKERSEVRQIESPRHRRLSNIEPSIDGVPAGKAEVHSMVRPIGQVSPAPRNNSNSAGVSNLQNDNTLLKTMGIKQFGNTLKRSNPKQHRL